MKVAALIAVAMSGIAIAAPEFKRTGTEWKDLTKLKYGNSVPVPKVAWVKNGASKRDANHPYRDNRNLHYKNDVPLVVKASA